MSYKTRTMLLVAGLALVALVGLAHVIPQSTDAVRTVASAVWGS
jgi:hypothetical protein